ncbi:hypothetical protein EON65_22650 [archaeon]|nr:MAG: hypothetical protein EON65_22650 [archaeon]
MEKIGRAGPSQAHHSNPWRVTLTHYTEFGYIVSCILLTVYVCYGLYFALEALSQDGYCPLADLEDPVAEAIWLYRLMTSLLQFHLGMSIAMVSYQVN